MNDDEKRKIEQGMNNIESNLKYIKSVNTSDSLKRNVNDCVRAYEVSMHLITNVEHKQ